MGQVGLIRNVAAPPMPDDAKKGPDAKDMKKDDNGN